MNENNAKRLLSIALGLLLLFHGVDKLLNGIDGIKEMIDMYKLPYADYTQYLAYGVYIGEVIAPILLILGRYVRIAGVLVVINMLVVIFLTQSQNIFSLNEYGAWAIELQVLYLIMGMVLIMWVKPKVKK